MRRGRTCLRIPLRLVADTHVTLHHTTSIQELRVEATGISGLDISQSLRTETKIIVHCRLNKPVKCQVINFTFPHLKLCPLLLQPLTLRG